MDAKSANKRQRQGKPGPKSKRKRHYGWIAPASVWGFFVFACGGALNYFGSNPKILYLPAIATCVLILFWTHRYVSLKESGPVDRTEQTSTSSKSKRAKISFVDKRLILETNEPLRLAFGLINYGNSDAVVTVKDRTYYVSRNQQESHFRYQASPPMEVLVPAIPNAVRSAEMRFDLRITPEELATLNNGSVRLFFYARAEYRDLTGTHPLEFTAMYDAKFPGNLIAPPADIVFE